MNHKPAVGEKAHFFDENSGLKARVVVVEDTPYPDEVTVRIEKVIVEGNFPPLEHQFGEGDELTVNISELT